MALIGVVVFAVSSKLGDGVGLVVAVEDLEAELANDNDQSGNTCDGN